MKPLVHLENVDVALSGQTVLRGLTWRLQPGESWAILGGNGSGKSTFLKLVRGDLWPAPDGRGKRVYAFDGEEQFTAVGVREKIALVSPELQERYRQQEWTLTGRQVIHTGFFATDLLYQKPDARQKVLAQSIVRLLGVGELLARNVQQLSTGELRKILIARALAGSPRVLVCDEICDGLDARARARLLAALDRIARNGTQLLYTTHRAEELLPAITHTLLLESGHIVEQSRARPPTPPDNDGRGRATATWPRPVVRNAGTDTAKVLIRIRQANVFLGRKKILRDINWELRAGQHWAVLGPNGAGKTTFLKLITSELYPAVGAEVRRFELTPGSTIWDLRRKLGYLSPEFQANYREALTGAEVVASGFFSSVGLMEKITARHQHTVRRLIATFGLGALAEKSALRMSYGEFRKILLLRALVNDPAVLILDEPFDGLDAAAKADMAAALEQVARGGTSLILVTHHAADLPSCLTHAARLAKGRIVEQGKLRAGVGAP